MQSSTNKAESTALAAEAVKAASANSDKLERIANLLHQADAVWHAMAPEARAALDRNFTAERSLSHHLIWATWSADRLHALTKPKELPL